MLGPDFRRDLQTPIHAPLPSENRLSNLPRISLSGYDLTSYNTAVGTSPNVSRTAPNPHIHLPYRLTNLPLTRKRTCKIQHIPTCPNEPRKVRLQITPSAEVLTELRGPRLVQLHRYQHTTLIRVLAAAFEFKFPPVTIYSPRGSQRG